MMVKRRTRRRRNSGDGDINPDEIFIDSSNLPNFDTHQFEGRLEKSISRRTLLILGLSFGVFFLLFVGKVWSLQVQKGEFYFTKSENNRLRNSLIFSKRGIIYDRNGEELTWNVENQEDKSYDLRKYISLDGFSHVLGYLKYPSKDKYGFYYSDVFDGKDGVEKAYNGVLSGQNGRRIVEVDALGEIQSENIIEEPKDGENITLSIDSGLQAEMYREIKSLANTVHFSGGAAVIMDVHNGEILVMTSYPEYSSQVLTDGVDKNEINRFFNDKNSAFLNRITDGLYVPGSTVKPYIAYAALSEDIIDPLKNILSTGSISIPNPYDPSNPTIFRDWKAHGYVDMRRALAVSSDVYFYAVGGGYQDQKGLGITKIDEYMKMFGFGSEIPFTSSDAENARDLFSIPAGVIPTPEWKKVTFDGEDWRIGNTYHTSIGQYGFQVSPLQLVRAVSSLVNGGKLIQPEILLQTDDDFKVGEINLNLNESYLKIIREGMRDGVIKDYGVGRGLQSPNYTLGIKTGTAELGVYKQFVNSWITGFFPYENPRYAFTVIMEKGPVANTTGALSIMRQALDWMVINRPEYLE